jgi:hypothetical protein
VIRDRDGETLCALPADDADAGAVAVLSSPGAARWSAGECTLDFALKRDGTGHVVQIDVAATPACKSYCRAGFGLSDQYQPANNWVAGNQ